MMKVRLATVDDKPRIIEMGLRFLALTKYGQLAGGGSADALAPLVDVCLLLGAVFLVETDVSVFVDGDLFTETQVVGMLVLYVARHPLTSLPYGDEVAWWVEPEHRNGRAGHYLLRSCEEWARQNGLSVLKMVAPADSRVGDFYLRHGFTLVETVYHKQL
jgi:GNAT superfamily N-acetyltransferase